MIDIMGMGHASEGDEITKEVEEWMEATLVWQDEDLFEDPIHVTTTYRGTVSGTVFHTTDHMKEDSHHGNGTPRWRYIERENAVVFGMRECKVCERTRTLSAQVDDGIVVMQIKDDRVKLRVLGRTIWVKVGQMTTAKAESVSSLTDEVKEQLGIGDDA